MSVSLQDVEAAAAAIQGHVVRTPTIPSGPLSTLHGAGVFIKLETLQHTGSFKDRGALVKMQSLSAAERSRGVITVSAGNHAQGVAYHAQHLGLDATIVMPEGTPFTKIRRTEAFGVGVVLHGEGLSAAESFAHDLAEREGLTFVHPYDDERIICGQGTIALEMLEDVPDLQALIVPVGGGGLVAGIATAAKALSPTIEVIGVESELYPTMYNEVHGIEAEVGGDSIADGIAVKRPGLLTRPIVERLVDELILVGETAIESAVQSMLTDAAVLVEGAGATPLAALAEHPARFEGKRVGLVATGGNIDPRILASVLMRGLSRAGHLVRLRISISDRPGTLAKVALEIGALGGNIVEIYHQRMFYDVPVKRTELDAVVETRDAEHAEEIIARLDSAGFPTRRLRQDASGM